MKLLSMAIFKICVSAYGIHDEERILSCFDKYVNCAIDAKTTAAAQSEKASLEKLKKCEAK